MTEPANSPAETVAPQQEPTARNRWVARHGRIRWQAVAVAVLAALAIVFGVVTAVGGTRNVPATDTSLGIQALQNLSSFEKQVLADKHVTADEIDEAMGVYTQCLTDSGIRYEIQPGPRGMGNVLMFGGPAEGWAPGTEQQYDEAMEHCSDEVSAVQNVWILQNHVEGAYPAPLPGLAEALDTLDTSGW